MRGQVIDWVAEVEKRKDELISCTQSFLRIRSVLDEQSSRPEAPFGEGIAEALEYVLDVCNQAGMSIKNVDGYAGHAEIGQGEQLIGILSHVDVVPEGEGWSTPPFAAEIVEGKLVARGAIDDKGPTMAAIFAAKIVKELGLPLGKRVRLIFGTDEETSWQCVKRYFETEEMPLMGFSPDADFPLIYAEKGMLQLIFRQAGEKSDYVVEDDETKGHDCDAIMLQFDAGLRINMVPDFAKATLQAKGKSAVEIRHLFLQYLESGGLSGSTQIEGDDNSNEPTSNITLSLKGLSVHAMDPAKGVNAGTKLLRFLAQLQLDKRADQLVRFSQAYLYQQHGGEALGIAHDDQEMGALTLNPGILRYQQAGDAELHINIRYPHSVTSEQITSTLRSRLNDTGWSMELLDHMTPHRVQPDHPLVTTLQKVYTEQTGEVASLIAIGGATYARSLQVGVAFGPLFPGRSDCAHQVDEHIDIADLLRATAIYAQAIYELAKV